MSVWKSPTNPRLTLGSVLAVLLLSLARVSASPFEEPLPEPTKKVAPIYPDVVRRAGLQGTVLVEALVGGDGRVREMKVVRSLPGLDSAALIALRQWRFKPPVANGKPMAAWVAVPFRFGPGEWTTEETDDPMASMTWAVVVRADSSSSLRERIAFYVNRLGDSTYVEYYYDGDPRSWVVAPEELGMIGAPALPSLIQALSATKVPYERTQIFYALLLAAQGPGTDDPAAQAELRAMSARFPEAFPPESQHAELKELWLRWWKNHRDHISSSAPR